MICTGLRAARSVYAPPCQWTSRELADELVKQGIVMSLSPRHVGRLLAEADLKPQQSGYWLNLPPRPQF